MYDENENIKSILQNILKIFFLSLLLHVCEKFKIKTSSFVPSHIWKVIYLKMN